MGWKKYQTCFFDRIMLTNSMYSNFCHVLREKAKNNALTQAEFLILKDFDLAELRAYEQAKELTVELLKKWLVKYKFKNWSKHKSNGKEVTIEEKKQRAEEIAANLGDNKKWKSHGRPINIEELEELGLQIEDYTNKEEYNTKIRNYYKLLLNYLDTYNMRNSIFVHTRKFI